MYLIMNVVCYLKQVDIKIWEIQKNGNHQVLIEEMRFKLFYETIQDW